MSTVRVVNGGVKGAPRTEVIVTHVSANQDKVALHSDPPGFCHRQTMPSGVATRQLKCADTLSSVTGIFHTCALAKIMSTVW
jgi:hypothetical protein